MKVGSPAHKNTIEQIYVFLAGISSWELDGTNIDSFLRTGAKGTIFPTGHQMANTLARRLVPLEPMSSES